MVASLADELGLQSSGPMAFAKSTLYSDKQVYSCACRSVCLGTSIVRNVILAYPADRAGSSDGLLGMGYLAHHRVLIDYPARLVYLKRVSPRTHDVTWASAAHVWATTNVLLDDGKSHLFVVEPAWPTVVATSVARVIGGSSDGRQRMTLRIGGANGLAVSVCARLDDFKGMRASIAGVDGVLGWDALAGLGVRIAQRSRRLTFVSPGNVAAAGEATEHGARLPLLMTAEGLPALSARIDGQAWIAVPSMLARRPTVGSACVAAALKPIAARNLVGQGSYRRLLRMERLSLGDTVWPRPLIVDDTLVPSGQRDVIGGAFWERFDVLLDGQGDAIYLKPMRDVPGPYEAGDCVDIGIELGTTLEGGIVVGSVAIPSPAGDAGLCAGDEVLVLGGMDARKVSLATLVDRLPRKVGGELVIKVRHRGDTAAHEYRLKARKLL